MSTDLSEYEYLWNGTQTGWVLVRSNLIGDSEEFTIYNEQKGRMLLIEDAETQRLVCERLLSLGVIVLEDVPKRQFDIATLDIEE